MYDKFDNAMIDAGVGYTDISTKAYQRDSFGDGLYRDGNDYYRMIGNRLHRMEVKQKRESV